MAQFTDKEWRDVLAQLTTVIGADAARYEAVPAAKLFAAIPYLSSSEDPDRFALSDLLTFHAATRARAVFNHRPSDDEDVFRRLATFHVGNHADPRVVDYGLTLLALISLSDHEHDIEGDQKSGKYNPIVAGRWDTKAMRTALQADLDKSPALKELFAEVVPMDGATASWWAN